MEGKYKSKWMTWMKMYLTGHTIFLEIWQLFIPYETYDLQMIKTYFACSKIKCEITQIWQFICNWLKNFHFFVIIFRIFLCLTRFNHTDNTDFFKSNKFVISICYSYNRQIENTLRVNILSDCRRVIKKKKKFQIFFQIGLKKIISLKNNLKF